jgi:uncharacterized protein (TIGR01370 family)
MIDFVAALTRTARAREPRFRVVVQNAEELLAESGYLALIDAVAKEDLLYGIEGDGMRNGADDVAHSIRHLQIARRAGKPVFVVEYLDAATARSAGDELIGHGFIPYFAERLLDRPPRGVRSRSAGRS